MFIDVPLLLLFVVLVLVLVVLVLVPVLLPSSFFFFLLSSFLQSIFQGKQIRDQLLTRCVSDYFTFAWKSTSACLFRSFDDSEIKGKEQQTQFSTDNDGVDTNQGAQMFPGVEPLL